MRKSACKYSAKDIGLAHIHVRNEKGHTPSAIALKIKQGIGISLREIGERIQEYGMSPDTGNVANFLRSKNQFETSEGKLTPYAIAVLKALGVKKVTITL